MTQKYCRSYKITCLRRNYAEITHVKHKFRKNKQKSRSLHENYAEITHILYKLRKNKLRSLQITEKLRKKYAKNYAKKVNVWPSSNNYRFSCTTMTISDATQ